MANNDKIYVLEHFRDGVVGVYDTRSEALHHVRRYHKQLAATAPWADAKDVLEKEFKELCENGANGSWSITETTEEEFFAEPTEEELAEYKARRHAEVLEEMGREYAERRAGLPSHHWEPGAEDASEATEAGCQVEEEPPFD